MHSETNLGPRPQGIQERWGRALLDRVEWRGDESVLDAGCGSGRLFPALLARIPKGKLTGVDSDAEMLAGARLQIEALRPAIPVQLVQQSLTNLYLCDGSGAGSGAMPCLPGMVDVILANGVFHWIGDKIGLYSHLIHLLRPEGRLLAESGGERHLQRVRAAAYRAARQTGLENEVGQWLSRFQLVPPAETKNHAKVCGFRQVRVSEQPDEVVFPDRAAFLQAASGLLFRSLRTAVEPGQWTGFLEAFSGNVHELLGGWRLDAVRQSLEARR